ncbi:Flp pilus assembly protein CpaB [Chengkuizengella sp. SCS-71B]|uniref:Flp pilus assembly protein CpaB n=1 Tax=Chengkuizengella sp. SCS-71B TaxID=3115290 RepID=UPI0032C212A5
MMKKRFVFIMIGLVFATIAGFLAYMYTLENTETKMVYVFNQNIDNNQPLHPNMLTEKELPLSAIPTDAVFEKAKVLGKSVKGYVFEDAVLRSAMLVDTSKTAMSGKLLEKGDANTRAIALPVNIDTTVGGSIKTGDFIDLYILDNNIKSSVKLAEAVEVIKGVSNKSSANDLNNKSIILSLPVDIVDEYADYMASGAKDFIALRPLGDDGSHIIVSEKVELSEVLADEEMEVGGSIH